MAAPYVAVEPVGRHGDVARRPFEAWLESADADTRDRPLKAAQILPKVRRAHQKLTNDLDAQLDLNA